MPRWLLRESLDPTVAIVVSPDQDPLTGAELMEMQQGLAQGGGEALAGMDQIAQQQQLAWRPLVAEIQQRVQRAAVTVAREGDAMGLEGFGLAKVQVSHHELSTSRTPQGALGKKTEGFIPPGPVQPIHQDKGSRWHRASEAL